LERNFDLGITITGMPTSDADVVAKLGVGILAKYRITKAEALVQH
jgi:hypothetical protein